MLHALMIVYQSEKVTPKHIFWVKTEFQFRRNSLISYEFKKSIFSYLKRFEITDKSYECKNVTKPQKYYILIIFWRFDITKYTLNVHRNEKNWLENGHFGWNFREISVKLLIMIILHLFLFEWKWICVGNALAKLI